jgi:exocyst complex component 6
VNELWDSMVSRALQLIEAATANLHNAESVLKIKRVLSVFIQTMDGLEYSVTSLNAFLPGLFQKYARLLLAEYSKNVNEVFSGPGSLRTFLISPDNIRRRLHAYGYSRHRRIHESH